jgi:hypothetical protein
MRSRALPFHFGKNNKKYEVTPQVIKKIADIRDIIDVIDVIAKDAISGVTQMQIRKVILTFAVILSISGVVSAQSHLQLLSAFENPGQANPHSFHEE